MSEDPWREVFVWSPDTDVLNLLLHLASSGRLDSLTHLKMLTGKGSKFREIDIMKRVRALGPSKCQGLIGFHNFSGADWGGKFVGISKKTWVDAYFKLDEEDPAVHSFKDLGEGLVPEELVDGELPSLVKPLERFLCQVYGSSTGPTSVRTLRWELWRSKNMEGEMLPPTRSALLPHIRRVNYVAMRDKSYHTNHPALPPIEENGWNVENGVFIPVMCLALPAPLAVIELVKCKCKTGCVMAACSCSKNNLPCTPLCKCYGAECANNITSSRHKPWKKMNNRMNSEKLQSHALDG